MTLTLSNLPQDVDDALRRRAESEGKSVDQVAIEAIRSGLGVFALEKKRDLSEFAGSWVPDPEVEAHLSAQDQIDPELWK